MESMVYQFDVTSSSYMSTTGGWSADGGTYYYAVIPLEVGKAYKIALQNVTTLARFRIAQADSNEIGVATLSMVTFNDSPQDGYTFLFVAKKDYLICYGGTANGGEVLATSVAIEGGDIIGTWTVNENVTDFMEKVRINCVGRYYYRYNNMAETCEERSIGYIGYPDTTYKRNYFAVAESYYGIGFSGANLVITDDGFTSSVQKTRAEAQAECFTFVIESVDADAGSEEYQTVLAWLKVNATKQGGEEVPTLITYNGETIATLEAGQTATIKTAETEVEHDIVITPVFPIEIAYGDIGIIGTAEAGQTATIKCANTEADFDIVVSAKAEEDDSIVGTWVFDKGAVNYDLFIAEAEGVTDKQIHLLYSASNTVSPVLGRIDTQDILYGNYGVFNTCIQYKISGQYLQFVVSNDGATASGVISAPVDYAQGKTWTFYDTCNDADIVVHPVLLEWLKTFATKQ